MPHSVAKPGVVSVRAPQLARARFSGVLDEAKEEVAQGLDDLFRAHHEAGNAAASNVSVAASLDRDETVVREWRQAGRKSAPLALPVALKKAGKVRLARQVHAMIGAMLGVDEEAPASAENGALLLASAHGTYCAALERAQRDGVIDEHERRELGRLMLVVLTRAQRETRRFLGTGSEG